MSRSLGPAAAPVGYRAVAGLLHLGMWLARWRLDVRGLDHVPPRGGAVLTFNHNGHLDFAALLVPLYRRTGRWVRLLAVRELWDSGVVALGVRVAHCVPVDRGSRTGREGALRDAVAAARDGQLVAIAPEGTLSPSGELQQFHTGAARIARAAGVPLLPAATWGTQWFSTTGRPARLRRAWRLPVAVRVGAPLLVGSDEAPEAATTRLADATAALLAEARSCAARDAGWRTDVHRA